MGAMLRYYQARDSLTDPEVMTRTHACTHVHKHGMHASTHARALELMHACVQVIAIAGFYMRCKLIACLLPVFLLLMF